MIAKLLPQQGQLSREVYYAIQIYLADEVTFCGHPYFILRTADFDYPRKDDKGNKLNPKEIMQDIVDRINNNKMFKYKLGQDVWHMYGDKICKSKILSRKFVENLEDCPHFIPTFEQRWNPKIPFGKNGVKYNTTNGILLETELFRSKEELVVSLLESSGNCMD